MTCFIEEVVVSRYDGKAVSAICWMCVRLGHVRQWTTYPSCPSLGKKEGHRVTNLVQLDPEPVFVD